MGDNERWLPVVGFEGSYSVSDRGRVRSENRIVPRGDGFMRVRERILRIARGEICGFTFVAHATDGTRKTVAVHRAVAAAFMGPRELDHEVRHMDGNHFNNNLSNLTYGTRSENQMDRVRHGTSNRGSRNTQSVMSEDDVVSIRKSTDTNASLARSYNVSPSTISMIRSRKRWSWLG